MTVGELLKGREPYSVDADQSVLAATEYMVRKNIGAVTVLREGELVGIFSERDLMKKVVAGHRSPGVVKVHEVMTAHPRTVSSGDSLEDCMFLMREHAFRHLPVVDGEELVGILSLRDVMLHEIALKQKQRGA